jgi:hypothetical protein
MQSGAVSRVVLLLPALLSLAACDGPADCPLLRVSSPSGTVRDEAGNLITPTRVVRRDQDGEQQCDLHFGGYDCWERGSRRAEITIFVGEQSWTQSAKIEYDGCHEDSPPLDFVLEKLPVCKAAAAVEGTYPASSSSDDDVVVTLESIPEGFHDLRLRTECDIAPPAYSCPALRQFDNGKYRLRLESAFSGNEVVELQISASDCQVETQHHDFK